MRMQRDDLMKLRAGIQDNFLTNKEKGYSLGSLRGIELTLLPAPEKNPLLLWPWPQPSSLPNLAEHTSLISHSSPAVLTYSALGYWASIVLKSGDGVTSSAETAVDETSGDPRLFIASKVQAKKRKTRKEAWMSCVKCVLCPEAQSQMQKNALKEKKCSAFQRGRSWGPYIHRDFLCKGGRTAAVPAVSPCAGGTLSALM